MNPFVVTVKNLSKADTEQLSKYLSAVLPDAAVEIKNNKQEPLSVPHLGDLVQVGDMVASDRNIFWVYRIIGDKGDSWLVEVVGSADGIRIIRREAPQHTAPKTIFSLYTGPFYHQ